ncbi:MAG TPA: peptidoglycan DD-metalloendopeptidase family protein [Bacillota bacterium]
MAALAAVAGMLLAVLMVWIAPVAAQSQSDIDRLRREIEKYRQQQQDLERRQNQLEQQIHGLRGQERSLTTQLAELDRELTDTRERIAVAEARLADAEARLRRVEADLAAAEERLARRNDLLSRRVRAIAEHGMIGYIEVLLASEDFADFLSRFQLLRQIIDQDVTLLEAARADREAVADLKAKVEFEREQIVLVRAYLEEEKQEIEVKTAQRQDMLEQIQSDREAAEAAEEELERQSRLNEQMLQEMEDELARLLGGDCDYLSWPVDRTGYYRLSSTFGPRWHPILRVNRPHNGVDFAKPRGANIYAAADGIVVHAGPNGGYGNAVIIAHCGTVATLYAHADRVLVSAGQQVQRGQVIAQVGATGLATGPHLHFEVRERGKPVDPMPYLNP